MDAETIDKILSRDKFASKIFEGVYARDELSRDLNFKNNKVFGIVVNTAKSTDAEGVHWVTIFKDEDKLIFFDSLGDPPSYSFRNFIKKIKSKRKIELFNFPIQHYSTSVCGFYCVLFLLYVSRKKLSNFLDIFLREERDILNNDKLVCYFFHLKYNTPLLLCGL